MGAIVSGTGTNGAFPFSIAIASVAGSDVSRGSRLWASVVFSGGGVGSDGSAGALVSSEDSEGEGVASRPIKDVGEAEEAVVGWGTEKPSVVVASGGLNKLSLDRSVAVDSSVDIWRTVPKLNCAGPFPASGPLSPKLNVGLEEESLASP